MAEGKGVFIVFEGTDGTGKSTQLSLLADSLRAKNFPVVTTKEPTEGRYGQEIRRLYTRRSSCTPRRELELFLDDRKEHVTRLINPAVGAGKIVLCDRYFLSTVAYQGALGFDVEELIQLNSFAPPPDLALVFHAPLETGRRRITAGRGEELNDFEQNDYLTKVAAIFDALDMDYIRRIDAGASIDTIHELVLSQVLPIIAAKQQA